MIIRIMVIDPAPRKPLEDVIVYQVPEKSRAHELLVEILEKEGLDFVPVRSSKKKEKSDAANPN